MTEWVHKDAFKSWTEAQKRLWDSLCTAVPAFQPPESMGLWQDTYLKNLAAWEAAVKQSLEIQASWVERWAQQMAGEQDTPEAMAEWTRQVEEVMQHWINTQSRLWDDWFAMLRASGARVAETSGKPQLPGRAEEPEKPSETERPQPEATSAPESSSPPAAQEPESSRQGTYNAADSQAETSPPASSARRRSGRSTTGRRHIKKEQ